MAALAVGAVVFVGLVTLVLSLVDSVPQTQAELVTEANILTRSVGQDLTATQHHDSLTALHSILHFLKGPLKLNGEFILAVSDDGSFYDPAQPSQKLGLPVGITITEGQTAELILTGSPISGHNGRLAWAASLVQYPVRVGNGLSLNVVVVLSKEAPIGVGDVGLWFGFASAVTVLVALIAANRLARRLARPLQQVEVATRRIAAGELEATVPVAQRQGRELVSLANSVNRMAIALARAKATQRQFLMSVSHELRTPLTSVRGFAEALVDGSVENVPYAANIILTEGRRLERLVGDLLELAKLEGGVFTLHMTKVDLSALVAHQARAFGPSAAGLGLAIELASAPRPAPGEGIAGRAAGAAGRHSTSRESGPMDAFTGGSDTAANPVLCQADPDRLGQIIANLIENALKYASARVALVTAYRDGKAALFVEDDGPGIPSEDLERVFERLYQTNRTSSRKLGSGLGLAIVAELVNAMGGRVVAESPIAPSGGTRMVVELLPQTGRHTDTASTNSSSGAIQPGPGYEISERP